MRRFLQTRKVKVVDKPKKIHFRSTPINDNLGRKAIQACGVRGSKIFLKI